MHARFPSLILALIAAPLLARSADGLVGDGKADDTVAVQKAIDAGGAVSFPRGTYRLTRTITIDLDKNGFTSVNGGGVARFVMAGAGPAFLVKGSHGGTADPASLKPEIFARQRTPMIDGIEIIGAHPEADGVEATGTMQLTLTRVAVHQARHGVRLSLRNRNVIISDCHLYNNRGAGVFYDQVDLHQSNIIGSHISYNDGGGVVVRGGGVRNLHIGACDIEGNMSPDTPPTANVLIDCSEGSTAEVSITGCTLQHNSKSPGSANIRFIGKGKARPGDETPHWGHLTISGNVMTDVDVNIDLQHVRGATITGNSFGVGFEHDLRALGCSQISIGPNIFDRNPPYYRGRAAEAKGGLLLRDCSDMTITGLHLNGARALPAALQIINGQTINLSACTILDSDGAGLLLQNSRNCLITGCLINDRRKDRPAAPSLRVRGGEGNTCANNQFAHGQD